MNRMRGMWAVRLVAIAAMGVLLSGCATSNRLVPKTKVDLTESDPKTGKVTKTVSLELPKDMSAKEITLSRDTNGQPFLKIVDIKVRTNPEVIGAAGVAQADAIDALGDKLIQMWEKGIEMGKKGAGPPGM